MRSERPCDGLLASDLLAEPAAGLSAGGGDAGAEDGFEAPVELGAELGGVGLIGGSHCRIAGRADGGAAHGEHRWRWGEAEDEAIECGAPDSSSADLCVAHEAFGEACGLGELGTGHAECFSDCS